MLIAVKHEIQCRIEMTETLNGLFIVLLENGWTASKRVNIFYDNEQTSNRQAT